MMDIEQAKTLIESEWGRAGLTQGDAGESQRLAKALYALGLLAYTAPQMTERDRQFTHPSSPPNTVMHGDPSQQPQTAAASQVPQQGETGVAGQPATANPHVTTRQRP
jgi:hypothetical protein